MKESLHNDPSLPRAGKLRQEKNQYTLIVPSLFRRGERIGESSGGDCDLTLTCAILQNRRPWTTLRPSRVHSCPEYSGSIESPARLRVS
jgi:hypothetical protein